jgi:prepilin-type N-terminal cleavage/methylation domain-containing protein
MDKKGMTLVEVLIALLVTGIILSAVYFMFVRITIMNKEQQEYVQAQDGVRNVMLLIEKDIRTSSQHILLKELDGCYNLSDLEKPDSTEDISYCIEDGKFSRNDQVIVDGVDNLIMSTNNFYIEVSINSKFGRRELNHEKKIYLRSASR